MQAVTQLDRASFMYGSNDQMTSEVKDALSAFDLNKTGSVSTSELVAGAKALQEARSQGVACARQKRSCCEIFTRGQVCLKPRRYGLEIAHGSPRRLPLLQKVRACQVIC